MMRRMASLFKQDLTNALRDNLIIYMILGPIILALGVKIFLPSLVDMKATFAIEKAVGKPIIDRMKELGRVEQFNSPQAVRERVERNDDVPGIVKEGDSFAIILEGNEPDVKNMGLVIGTYLLDRNPKVEFDYIFRNKSSQITEYGTIVLVMIGLLLGALVSAFIIIDEKESGAIHGLAVSPLRMAEFTIARAFFGLVISFVIAFASSLILVGTTINYGYFIIGFLFSTGIAILIGYTVGGFADNQLQAIAILKFLMAAYLSVPITSIFVPRHWHFLFYALPNYWMFKIFENLYIGKIGDIGFWGSAAITLAGSILLILILFPILRKRLKFR